MRRAAAGLCSRKTKISLDSISPAFSLSKFLGNFSAGRMAEPVKACVRLLSRRREALGHPMQAFEVVGQADPLPFQSHFFFPAQKKLPESQNALDDTSPPRRCRAQRCLPGRILNYGTNNKPGMAPTRKFMATRRSRRLTTSLPPAVKAAILPLAP